MASVDEQKLNRLRAMYDDGTPRGMVWPVIASLTIGIAGAISTPDEAMMYDRLLDAMIECADEYAMERLEIQMCLQQLEDAMKRRKGGDA